jgi:hypothetical protein
MEVEIFGRRYKEKNEEEKSWLVKNVEVVAGSLWKQNLSGFILKF